MKVKIVDLLNTQELWGELLEGKLNGAVSLKIAEIVQEIGYKLKTFNERKDKLVADAGGVFNEKTKKLTFKKKDEEERVDKEFQEMLQSEVELHCRQLTSTDLEKMDIAPRKVLGILWAVETEEKPKEEE